MRQAKRVLGTIAVAGLVAGGLWVVAAFVFRTRVPFVLILAVVLAAAACRELLTRLRSPASRAVLVREDLEPTLLGVLPDRPFAGVRRWEDLLDGSEQTRREVVALVDERLRLTHRIDRADDSERAKAVVGPVIAGLWERDEALTQGELDTVIEEMEKLWATPR